MVEAPIEQTPLFAEENPLQSVYFIPFALQPPNILSICIELNIGNAVEFSQKYVEIELLKKFDYVIDKEADEKISSNIEYSYSRAIYKETQLVHKSGTSFVQIYSDGSGLQFTVNQIYTASTANLTINQKTVSLNNTEKLREELQLFCSDKLCLKEFYEGEIDRFRNTLIQFKSTEN